MSINDFNTPYGEQAQRSPESSFDDSKQSVGMKSLIKSYQNIGNADFYENLHKKYFNKAKGKKAQKKQESPEEELFDLTQSHLAISQHPDRASIKNSIFTKLTQKQESSHLIFSDNESEEHSRERRKEMSHLSQRDLFSKQDPSEQTQEQVSQPYVFDLSQVTLPSQIPNESNGFFSQHTQVAQIRKALESDNEELANFYQNQVRHERQKLQSKSTVSPQVKKFDTVPQQLVGSLRESALNQQSTSKLSGEGHQSDFTFVLSNPTTEQQTRVEH